MQHRQQEIERLQGIVSRLKRCSTLEERLDVLDSQGTVVDGLSKSLTVIFKSLLVIGQQKVLEGLEGDIDALRSLLSSLVQVDQFYESLGGLVGYHLQTLILLEQSQETGQDCVYYPPQGVDISRSTAEVMGFIDTALENLPRLGEIYAVGGAADRLRLCDPVTLDPLPAASLDFCGHTLLEWLIRDVEAREYLYYKRFGKKVLTPIAMMTSLEKNNHAYMVTLCEENNWFGRGKEGIRFFCQPLVPTMDMQGNWCVIGPGKLLMKPGGHGVLWKLAQDSGVFDWMKQLGRTKILVRQINNPIAGVDGGLLSFCGVGFAQNKQFGFASCSRQVKAAEGVNVVIKTHSARGMSCRLTNIEYCDFEKYAIEDLPMEPGESYSCYPSNTNILFADIDAVQEKIKEHPLPGMVVNPKAVSWKESRGSKEDQLVVRLESVMQNLADAFEVVCANGEQEQSLPTFLTYHHRHKTISAIKKMGNKDAPLLETPEGCLYDWLRNVTQLLQWHCHMNVPTLPEPAVYREQGAPFFFFYHPALGPLFSEIAQKIQRGKISAGSEVILEIAEVEMVDVEISGAFCIQCAGLTDDISRCVLKQVNIDNRGIDFSRTGAYWKGEVVYAERCVIKLAKNSEFYAQDVCLSGEMFIEVKEGQRVVAVEEEGRVRLLVSELAKL